jgi:hypothetical protein
VTVVGRKKVEEIHDSRESDIVPSFYDTVVPFLFQSLDACLQTAEHVLTRLNPIMDTASCGIIMLLQ